MINDLPGGTFLTDGLKDLRADVMSESALLVLIGAPRLTLHGFEIPKSTLEVKLPEHLLFDFLLTKYSEPEAYSRYNALLRSLVSLENALDSLANS